MRIVIDTLMLLDDARLHSGCIWDLLI